MAVKISSDELVVRKRRATFSRIKMGRFHRGFEWSAASRPFNNEIMPILEALTNVHMSRDLRGSLGNYLVIRLVSIMEYFFSNAIKKMVDGQDLNISGLMDEKTLREAQKLGFTNGQIASMSFYFGKYQDINTAFSFLLGFDFFEAVKALDKRQPYKFVKGAISLSLNWKDFQAIFELRNNIVHGMKDTCLSNRELRSLADNTMNVLEAAAWICHPKFLDAEKDLIRKLTISEHTVNP